MKDKIIEYLEQDSKAKTIIEINDYLKLTTSDDLERLQKEINELVKLGIVHETKKSKYMLMKDCASLHTGKLDVAKNGYAFLIQVLHFSTVTHGRSIPWHRPNAFMAPWLGIYETALNSRLCV